MVQELRTQAEAAREAQQEAQQEAGALRQERDALEQETRTIRTEKVGLHLLASVCQLMFRDALEQSFLHS